MKNDVKTPNQRRIFYLLAGYRWASLIPPLWAILREDLNTFNGVTPGILFIIALANNLIITFWYQKINAAVKKYPILLGIDITFVGAILAISGGIESPYYLYSLSPLLVSALFFQVKGAIIAAVTFTPVYIGIASFNSQLSQSGFFSQFAGFWIVTLFFSYPSTLVDQLRKTLSELREAQSQLKIQHDDISRSHQQLNIIHDMTMLIRAAPDIQSVQQQVLKAVTNELGYAKAAIGLVDPATTMLGNWASHPNHDFPLEGVAAMPLNISGGKFFQIFATKNPSWVERSEQIADNPMLVEWLSDQSWIIFPMIIQEHPVGVLFVACDVPPLKLPKEELHALTSLANQAAIGLGTTLMCIDRARSLAVEQERNRIAREIHDTVAQSLFGIVFSLDACVNMLPDQPDTVMEELADIRAAASNTHDDIRNSILDLWPSQLDWEQFQNDLRQYVSYCGEPTDFEIDFSANGGEFDYLSAGVRRNIYRISQEALVNVSQHAGVQSAYLTLDIAPQKVTLKILDYGVGFDIDMVTSRAYNRETFGLHGIQERVSAVGGTMKIDSEQNKGTVITVNIPLLAEGELT